MLQFCRSRPDPLHSACLLGDSYLEIAKKLLENTNIHSKNSAENTAIISACESNSIKIIKFLLKEGADINDRDSRNNSVLHLICAGLSFVENIPDYSDLISEFSKKINFKALNDNEETALHRLCCNTSNDISVKTELANFAQQLISLGIYLNAEDGLGNTAFHSACAAGNEEVVRMLIPMVENIDARNHEGDSALHLACKNGRTEIAEMLLTKYKTLTQDEYCEYQPFKNELGQTPLDLARIFKRQGTENKAEFNDKDSIDDKDSVDGLIFEETSAEFSRDEFSACVMDSIKIISREDLELDIKRCSTIENEGERNNALIASFEKMCLNLEKDLNSSGDDFDIGNPRQYAFFIQEREAFVQKILTNLSPNITNDSQTTALHLLCQYGYVAATEFAIGRGENLEHRNKKGQTALHLACEYGQVEVASLLIENGCDRNATNTLNQETPFDTALNNVHYDVATMLSEKFNVNISDSTAQLLSDEAMSKLEEGRKTEIAYLANTFNKNNPSPYPQPNDGSKKFTSIPLTQKTGNTKATANPNF